MNKFLLGVLLVAGLGRTAFATPELKLISGATTVTIDDGGSGDGDGLVNNQISWSGPPVDGWSITFAGGVSKSPNLDPFGISINSFDAECATAQCGANPLTIEFSDINFTGQTSNFSTSFSIAPTGSSSAIQNAYFDAGNGLFGTASPIGTVGPFTVANGNTVVSGADPSPLSNYSLTLIDVFTNTGTGLSTFSGNGNITGVPEPAAVVLFGTVLALYATNLRRKRKLSQEQQ